MIKEITIFLANENSTLALGENLSKNISNGLLIFLKGDLGVGKTTLVRGFLRSLGYRGRVKSPTYSLIEQYILILNTINHFDLYRFSNPEELLSSGFSEYVDQVNVNIIEWPEKASDIISNPDVTIEIKYDDIRSRIVYINAHTEKGFKCCVGLS